MPQGIVDLLETIEIHHQHRQPCIFSMGNQDRLPEPVIKQGPVGQPGQGVVQRLML